MGINILESGDLTKPEYLVMNIDILNSVPFLNIIYNCLPRVNYKFLYKSNRHTDTDETCRTERIKENIPTEVCV